MIRLLLASVWLQLWIFRKDPQHLMPLLTLPIMTVILLSIIRYASRPDLAAWAVLASALMAVLTLALQVSGGIVDYERSIGTIEMLLAAPAPLPIIVLGRIGTVTLVSLVAVVESMLVSAVGFDIVPDVRHPGWLFASLACGALALAGTATIMASVFVLTRSARTFQNSLSYPLFVLGGVMVPTNLLPDWIQPATKIVFLSWTTDLLRDCLSPEPLAYPLSRLAIILSLGAIGYILGYILLIRMAERARQLGTVGHA